MFKKFFTRLATTQDFIHSYRKEIKLETDNKIKNKKLYEDLKKACDSNYGVLTYAEYLHIDQFSKNGFYATNKKHGKTDIEKRWGLALSNYCQIQGFTTVIEFGCGTGELGIATVKAYKKSTNKNLSWIGVELDSSIHTKIFDNFAAQNLTGSVEKIVTSLDALQAYKNDSVLLVFPYSLDNIPPQIFISTRCETTCADSLIGIRVHDGMVSEEIIPPDIVQKKGILFKNGYFKQGAKSYNISNWKLRRGQRAYISIEAFTTLYEYTLAFSDSSHCIIIDELRKEPWFFNIGTLGIPKSLYEKNLICSDRPRYYKESGKHNLYYPLYINTVLQFLHTIGYRYVDIEIEQKKASELNKKHWYTLRENYSTFAITAKNFNPNKKNPDISISFTPQKLI